MACDNARDSCATAAGGTWHSQSVASEHSARGEEREGLFPEGSRVLAASAFEIFHPTVVIAYVTIALVITMTAFHPVIIALALVAALCAGACVRGMRQVARSAFWQAPLVALVALANPLFASVGSTELLRLGTHAIYLESLVYGLCMGMLLMAVMVQFSNASSVLTSDKVMGALGKRMPTVALMVSMCMRLIPRFVRRGREVSAVQEACTVARRRGSGVSEAKAPQRRNRSTSRSNPKAVSHPASEAKATSWGQVALEAQLASRARATKARPTPWGQPTPGGQSTPKARASFRSRMALWARLSSVLMAWGMEDSLETADAMRARAWASAPVRTTYRRQRFARADAAALTVVLALGAASGACAWWAASSFQFYPHLSTLTLWWGYVPCALYFFLPCLVVLGDRLRWMR